MNSFHDPSGGGSVELALVAIPTVLFVALLALYCYAPVVTLLRKLKRK